MAAGWAGTARLGAQAKSKTAYEPAKSADGQPDIQGYWGQRNNVTTYSLERGDEDRREHNRITGQRAATGRPIVDPPSGLIPYQPWSKKVYDHLLSVHTGPSAIQDLDPVARGFMEGTPRINLQTGFQIIQAPGRIVFLYEYGHHFRSIPLDGRPHLPEDMKLWMGDSRAHWEGNTLVVDVTNNNDQTWFDQVGAVHSSALHVVERWTAVSADQLDYEASIDDPSVFTQVWKLSMNYGRNRDKTYEQMESAVWEGNRAVELMVRTPGQQPRQ
jgi:hypothetical protein